MMTLGTETTTAKVRDRTVSTTGHSVRMSKQRLVWPPIAPLKMHMEAVAATASLYTHQLHADLSRHALQSSLRLWQPSILSAHVLHASGHHSSISLLR
jgi:hypothetical protein